MSHKRKVILKLIFSLRQEQVHFLHMRIVGNTMLNSLIREFIRLIVNCTVSYKKPIKSEFYEGEVSMKKIGLGIAILLFAIIISLCSSGMGLLVIGIGIVGLIFSIIGFIESK